MPSVNIKVTDCKSVSSNGDIKDSDSTNGDDIRIRNRYLENNATLRFFILTNPARNGEKIRKREYTND